MNSSSPAAIPRNVPKICLIVDADPVQLYFSRRLLQSAGIGAVIVGVSRGEEAVDYLDQLCRTIRGGLRCAPLAIFLEIDISSVEGFNGLDLLQWIRGKRALNAAKCIMLTSSQDPAHVARARSLGAAGYLLKHPPPSASAMRKWLLEGFEGGPWPQSSNESAA